MGEDPELPGTSLEGLGSYVALTLLNMETLCTVCNSRSRGTHGS